MGDDLQQQSFAMLPRVRREVATIDLDSSIHEVYGEKKEGADFAYNNTWSYSVLYGSWRRPVTCSIWICGKATGTPATAARTYYRE